MLTPITLLPITLPLAITVSPNTLPLTVIPVVVNTATFDVPAMVTLALPFAVKNPNSLLPKAMAFLVILPAIVALPVMLRSP